MVKFLVYTSNPPFIPNNMDEVINFAKEECKFRIASVELNPFLSNVKVGDHIVTKKGNVIYVLRTIDTCLEDIDDETRNYLDELTREYGLKKVGITSVEHIVKFETWCKSMKPIINKKETKSFSSRLKEMFMPQEADNIRIATDGSLCVATANGYVSINENNELTSYPEELTLDLPVFIISKPKEQLVEGDVIAVGNSYAKVTKIDNNKITTISYKGTGKIVYPIKDILFNQSIIRVVVSLAGNVGGQFNPMMLMLAKDNDSLLPLLMMNQNQGALNINPMMLMLMQDKCSTKDILMMSALGGNNLFQNMFNK